MGLFDSGIANFIRMLIVIGLISMLYMFVMQKVREQNHKITSMLTLITTLASEVNLLKSGSTGPVYMDEVPEELINVSEDESDSDSDSDSDVSEDEIQFENIILEKMEPDNIEFIETPIQEIFFESLEETIQEPEVSVEVSSESSVESLIEDLVESSIESKKYDETSLKKMSVQQLSQLALESKLISAEEVKKLKKPALITLLL